MPIPSRPWRAVPPAAKWGIGLWVGAWICFLLNYYRLTQDSASIVKLAIALMLLCIFLLRGQNWARMIALMADALAILFLVFLGYAQLARPAEAAIVFGSILVFVMSVYFLSLRATAAFFKSHK